MGCVASSVKATTENNIGTSHRFSGLRQAAQVAPSFSLQADRSEHRVPHICGHRYNSSADYSRFVTNSEYDLGCLDVEDLVKAYNPQAQKVSNLSEVADRARITAALDIRRCNDPHADLYNLYYKKGKDSFDKIQRKQAREHLRRSSPVPWNLC